ncbi:MAG: (2Fe-2S)-binding protein [Candidatus Aminicenantes bacterium]|nr:(2Fe-2S)-binding protein [Candidatus Aminicenantes bacterium]
MEKTISFRLNGKAARITTAEDRMLLWILRSDLSFTGTKYSCEEGYCGACTVLVNNEPVLSCQYPVQDVEGKEVLTIEGLQKNGNLHPIQEAFLKFNALQCGFCTPGMILGAYSLLIKNPQPSTQEIKASLEGNLCRCGTYQRIVQAVQTASQNMKGKIS